LVPSQLQPGRQQVKRTPEQAATVAAWLNVLDHAEAQLQSLGAVASGRGGREAFRSMRVRRLVDELGEARAMLEVNAAKRKARVRKAHESQATIQGLRFSLAEMRDVAGCMREELLTLARALGCPCEQPKMLEAVKALKGES
jgi:hypothetical protein